MGATVIDLYILDNAFNAVGVLDYYLSLSWQKNMLGDGKVEIDIPIDSRHDLSYIQRDHYITRKDDDMVAVITYTETREQSDSVPVYHVEGVDITGYILNKRVVWSNFIHIGTVTTIIDKLIEDNFSNANRSERNMLASDGTPLISVRYIGTAGDESMNYKTANDNIGDLIYSIVSTFRYGMQMTLSRSNGVVKLTLNIYRPTNRSSYVIFNKKFDNVVNTNFTSEFLDGSNVVLVAGETSLETGRRREKVAGELASGLDRNESFLDMSSLSRNISWHDFLKQYPPKNVDIYDIEKSDTGGEMIGFIDKSKDVKKTTKEVVKIDDAYENTSIEVGQIELPYSKTPYTKITLIHDSNYVDTDEAKDTSEWIVTRIIYPGDRGDDVAEMQRRLIKKGYSCGDPGADGVYGSLTANAVISYQRDLWPDDSSQWDGVCGRGTLGSLGAICKMDDGVKTTFKYERDLSYRDDPQLDTDAWVVRRVLRRGDRGEDVAEMQRRLIEKGYPCGNTADDGIFGPKTEAAAIAFQKDIWPDDSSQWDGICGQRTLTALGAVCRGGVYDDSWEVYQVLREGDRGEDVKEMQRRLIARGFSCGSTGADGIFGPNTLAAAIEFQKTVWPDDPSQWDGVCGHGTLGALGAIVKIDDGTSSNKEFYGGIFDFVAGKLYNYYDSDGEEKVTPDIFELKKIDLQLSTNTNAIYCDVEGSKVSIGYYYRIPKFHYKMGVFEIPILGGEDQLTELMDIYNGKRWYPKTVTVNNSTITYFCVEDVNIAIFTEDVLANPPEKGENDEYGNATYKTNPTAYADDPLYDVMLVQEGYKEYLKGTMDTSFSAEIDPNVTFKYKEDYILGDYVGIYNNYGIKAEVQITDITETVDSSGYHFDVTLSNASSLENQDVTIYCATDAVDTVYILTDDGKYITL